MQPQKEKEKAKVDLNRVTNQPQTKEKEETKASNVSNYTAHCTSLLDTSRQVLLDGKALVEMIHNPQDDIDDILCNSFSSSLPHTPLTTNFYTLT
jgi:hypothetical protein